MTAVERLTAFETATRTAIAAVLRDSATILPGTSPEQGDLGPGSNSAGEGTAAVWVGVGPQGWGHDRRGGQASRRSSSRRARCWRTAACRSALLNVKATAQAAWLALQHQLSAVSSRILLADADAKVAEGLSPSRTLYAFGWATLYSAPRHPYLGQSMFSSRHQFPTFSIGHFGDSCEFGRRKFPENLVKTFIKTSVNVGVETRAIISNKISRKQTLAWGKQVAPTISIIEMCM